MEKRLQKTEERLQKTEERLKIAEEKLEKLKEGGEEGEGEEIILSKQYPEVKISREEASQILRLAEPTLMIKALYDFLVPEEQQRNYCGKGRSLNREKLPDKIRTLIYGNLSLFFFFSFLLSLNKNE